MSRPLTIAELADRIRALPIERQAEAVDLLFVLYGPHVVARMQGKRPKKGTRDAYAKIIAGTATPEQVMDFLVTNAPKRWSHMPPPAQE